VPAVPLSLKSINTCNPFVIDYNAKYKVSYRLCYNLLSLFSLFFQAFLIVQQWWNVNSLSRLIVSFLQGGYISIHYNHPMLYCNCKEFPYVNYVIQYLSYFGCCPITCKKEKDQNTSLEGVSLNF